MAMTDAVREVLGRDVALAQNYLGYDQVKTSTPALLDDYVDIRRLERSPGYEARKRVFEERMSYLGEGVGVSASPPTPPIPLLIPINSAALRRHRRRPRTNR